MNSIYILNKIYIKYLLYILMNSVYSLNIENIRSMYSVKLNIYYTLLYIFMNSHLKYYIYTKNIIHIYS